MLNTSEKIIKHKTELLNLMAMVKLAAARIWIKYYELAACQCRNPDSETGGLPGEYGERSLRPEDPKWMMKYACRDFPCIRGYIRPVKAPL